MKNRNVFLGIFLLVLTSCVHPNRNLKSKEDVVSKKVMEIDSMRYQQMTDKLLKLDYYDTTDQNAISNTQLTEDFYDFLMSEVNDYNLYKPFMNEMTSSRDTIFILTNSQNFYRYIKKDSKTKLIFDSYMEDTRSLPKKLKQRMLNLTKDRSKALVMSDSTFTMSIKVTFKSDTIHRLIFVYYLD
jgi:hypothetical protein